MYIPAMFRMEEDKDKIAFMQKYSFATIITCKDTLPIATQLPFVVKQKDDKLILSAHFAIANEQVNYIEEQISLVIFTEPHAYISPSHYDKVESVPTWDYIAVHAYGKATILHTEEEKITALEEMIDYYEKDYQQQWQGLSEKFKKGMIKGIVAFEITVSSLQGQQKLSQNKSKVEVNRIVNHLENSDLGVEKELATYIRKANIE